MKTPQSRIQFLFMAILLLFLSLFLISSSEAYVGVTIDTAINNLPNLVDIGNAVNGSVLRHVRLMNMDTNVISTLARFNLHMIVSSNSEENNSQIIDSFGNNYQENDWATALLPWADKIDMFVFAGQFIGGCCDDEYRVTDFFEVMRRLHYAFSLEMKNVKVTTSINVSVVIQNLDSPSDACVRPEYYERMKNLLNILREHKAPLLVNIYPFYEYQLNPAEGFLPFYLFQNNPGRIDPVSGLKYDNMFDWQLDAVRNAIDGLEYEDVEIIVAESGWPAWSHGLEVEGASIENAGNYNKHLVHHLSSNKGTPMRPKTYVTAYVHTLLDQHKSNTDLKLGFGLLNQDLSWRYSLV